MVKKNDNFEDTEIFDFEDISDAVPVDATSDDDVEMLDFESDKKVSAEIDEMLDFIETPSSNNNNVNLDKLLEANKDDKNKIELDASSEKLDEYKPNIKDFNIKSAKTRRIVKKSLLYVIIVMLLGFEFFINKTGDILNNLTVYASNNQPIRIIQNDKYGYIDNSGDKIVNPKYVYGENFIKGYAIVKNSSNFPLIIDKGGKEVVKSGYYFSLYRADKNIIASKSTKSGLKYGILSPDLKVITKFKYDSISYKNGIYTYVNGNVVGLINEEGKDIYSYKLNDKDDKVIDAVICPVTNDTYERYGVVKVNSSSMIVNFKDGTEVTHATLNEIVPEENNVFYEVSGNGSKTFSYVQNNKVLVESDIYTSLSMNSIETGVLKAINNSYKYEFISTKTMEQLKKDLSDSEVYYGDNVVLYLDRNTKRNSNVINFVKNGEVYKSIPASFEVVSPFKNGIAVIKYNDGLYGYINEDAELITDIHFTEANEFDSYGEAIAKTENGYGVINKKGKIIIKFENEDVKMASDVVKKISQGNNKNVFYAVKKTNKYLLYADNGKRVLNKRFIDVNFDENYPIVKVSSDIEDALIITESLSKITLLSFNQEYTSYENYIVIKNEYYNYKGKLIYVDNNKAGD